MQAKFFSSRVLSLVFFAALVSSGLYAAAQTTATPVPAQPQKPATDSAGQQPGQQQDQQPTFTLPTVRSTW